MTAVPEKFAIEPLEAERHDRSQFDCGIESLNVYLKQLARQDMKRGAAAPFVILKTSGESHILGYYTLSMTGVSRMGLPAELLKGLPKYADLPAVLLGRLAVDCRLHSQGIGQILLADAVLRSLRSEIAWSLMVVDAIDERAAAFYRHHEFLSFEDQSNRLFVPRKLAEAWLLERADH